MSTNYRIIIANWYRVYTQHLIIFNSPYKQLLPLILQEIRKFLPKIVFALSAEHDLRAENIGPRIIMDIDVVGFMDEEDCLSSAITCDIFC